MTTKKNNNLAEKIQEMIELGLWPRDLSIPDPQLIERIIRLDEDIYNRKLELYSPENNQEMAIQKAKEILLSKNRQKFQERKQKKETKLLITDWKKYKDINFVHLGKTVSGWLNNKDTDEDTLNKLKLPILRNAQDLEKFISTPIAQIKWLAYQRKVSRVNHYIEFKIAKKSGGFRIISKPKTDLMKIQQKIKTEILDKIPLPDHIFGFKKSYSIFDNANYHLKSRYILNLDIDNFFSNVTFYQVRSEFHKLGFSGEISTVLALLCTNSDSKQVIIDDKKYYHYSNIRKLPQGAPTSPYLSNLVGINFDKEILKRIEKLDFKYSRYADDITLSTKSKKPKFRGIFNIIRRTLAYYNFRINENKTLIRGNHERQEITGLIINSGKSLIPRKWRRELRAAVHNYEKLPNEEKEKEKSRILASIAYLQNSHPKEAKKLFQKIN